MSVSFSVALATEDAPGDGHRGHGLRPAGVEGEMGDGFDELVFAVAVLLGEVEVVHELVGVAEGGERGDGHETALLGRQLGALPDLAEQHVVGEVNESGGEVTEEALGAGRLVVVGGVGHESSWVSSAGARRSVVAAASFVTMAST